MDERLKKTGLSPTARVGRGGGVALFVATLAVSGATAGAAPPKLVSVEGSGQGAASAAGAGQGRTPAAPGRAASVRPRVPGAPAPERLAESLLLETNLVRRERGLAPLEASPDLAAAALSHAEDMLARGFFGHRSPEGGLPVDRLKRTAAKAIVLDVRENLSRSKAETCRTAAACAKATVAGWMGSPAHRENILAAGITHVGFGWVTALVEGDRVDLYVQLFGRVVGRWETIPPETAALPARWNVKLSERVEFFLEDSSRPKKEYFDPTNPDRLWTGGVPVVLSHQAEWTTLALPAVDPGPYALLARKPGDEGFEPIVRFTVTK